MLKKFVVGLAIVTASCASFRPSVNTVVSNWDGISAMLPEDAPFKELPPLRGDSHAKYFDKLVKLSKIPVHVVPFNAALSEFYEEDVTGMYGLNDGKVILLNDSLSPNERVSTLAHEIAHSLQPKDVPILGNPKEGNYFAQTVAYLFCERIGLKTGMWTFWYFKYIIDSYDLVEWDTKHEKEIEAAVDYLLKGVQ